MTIVGHPPFAPGVRWRNWSRSEQVTPRHVVRPTSVDEVVEVVQRARETGLAVKAIGSGHSFTGIAVAPGVQLDLANLTGVLDADAATGRVRIAAGTRLHELPALLAHYGLAMENLGDIDRQSISGATSTGTHGTGLAFTGLAGQLVAATLVTADGEVLEVDDASNADLLASVRLGLGALGILVDVTVRCVPAFALSALERPEPLETVLGTFVDRVRETDHLEFYWFPHTGTALTKTNTRLAADAVLAPLGRGRRWFDDSVMSNGVFRATCATGRALPSLIPPINRVATRLTGNRSFTDVSTRVFTTKRTVRFREMEYGIPLDAVPTALREVRSLIERRGWRVSFPLEVRAAAADDLWLSTAYGRETGYIAVHRYWREPFEEYFRGVEEIMVAHGGRPHWGKLHFRDANALADVYPRFADFLAVRGRLDPERVFTNPYLERVLGA